jgi:hypothetical protein
LYKVSLRIQGAGMFRIRTLEEVQDFCDSTQESHRQYSFAHRSWEHRHELQDLAKFLLENQDKTWTKRIETKTIDFYTNDVSFYNDMSLKFNACLIHKYEPSTDTIELLESSSNIVVKQLPHNRYNYRVYLLPHKLKGDKEAKQKFINWVKNQGDKITCTPAVESWFITTEWNWDRRYVLVEDESTLLMLKLRNSEVVGRIYNFVVSDK